MRKSGRGKDLISPYRWLLTSYLVTMILVWFCRIRKDSSSNWEEDGGAFFGSWWRKKINIPRPRSVGIGSGYLRGKIEARSVKWHKWFSEEPHELWHKEVASIVRRVRMVALQITARGNVAMQEILRGTFKKVAHILMPFLHTIYSLINPFLHICSLILFHADLHRTP